MSDLREKKEKLLGEQEEMKGKLKYVESDYYIEQVARNQLHLSKPGETIVVVGEEIGNVLGEEDDKLEEMSNWEKWMEVLFGDE